MKFLEGKKTYIGVIGLFVLGGLLALNLIDQKTFETWSALIGGFTAYGLRKAIDN